MNFSMFYGYKINKVIVADNLYVLSSSLDENNYNYDIVFGFPIKPNTMLPYIISKNDTLEQLVKQEIHTNDLKLLGPFFFCGFDITEKVVSKTTIQKFNISINFDGASKGNPGHSGYGYIIKSDGLFEDIIGAEYIGITTNNIAEYSGILNALKRLNSVLCDNIIANIKIMGDSQLVIKQLLGEYKVSSSNIKSIFETVINLISSLRQRNHMVELIYIPRECNIIADKLASNIAGINKNKNK